MGAWNLADQTMFPEQLQQPTDAGRLPALFGRTGGVRVQQRGQAEPVGPGPRKPYWDSARRGSSIVGHIRSSSARARISLSG
jgi:hypothetical protein